MPAVIVTTTVTGKPPHTLCCLSEYSIIYRCIVPEALPFEAYRMMGQWLDPECNFTVPTPTLPSLSPTQTFILPTVVTITNCELRLTLNTHTQCRFYDLAISLCVYVSVSQPMTRFSGTNAQRCSKSSYISLPSVPPYFNTCTA